MGSGHGLGHAEYVEDVGVVFEVVEGIGVWVCVCVYIPLFFLWLCTLDVLGMIERGRSECELDRGVRC